VTDTVSSSSGRDNDRGQLRALRDRRFVSERARCASTTASTKVAPPGPSNSRQTELAYLDLVAVDQHRGLDRFLVDVSAVEAVEVDDQELSVLPAKLGVAAANSGVVEENVAVWMPARRCDRSIGQDREPASGPGITSSRAERLGGPFAAGLSRLPDVYRVDRNFPASTSETRDSTPSTAVASNSSRR
jgi:hypothetical protein